MPKFEKLNSALDRMEDRLDALEAQGVDITKLSTSGRNLTAESLRKDRERFEKKQAAGRAASAAAASTFELGQMVRTRRGDTGPVVEITDAAISIEINGSVRKFAPTMISAA